MNIGEKGQPLFKNKAYHLPDCSPEGHLLDLGALCHYQPGLPY